jgi:putative transposase
MPLPSARMLTVSRHYPVEQRERAMKVVLDHLSEYRSVYAAFVVDCYSGAIVGWQAATVENTAMVTTALKISFAEAIVLERITASIGRVGGNNRRLHSQLNYLPPEEYEAPTTPTSRRPSQRRLNNEGDKIRDDSVRRVSRHMQR